MRVISFNINGVRARPHQLTKMIELHNPDIIGLQETKVQNSEYPVQLANDLGYHCFVHGQKGHHGVSLLSRIKPVAIERGLAGDKEDEDRRLIMGTFETSAGLLSVYCVYFPQGENRSHEWKFPYKVAFFERITHRINQHSPDESVIVMGDTNVSPQDQDIGIGEENRLRWLKTGKCSFLPEEREMLQTLTAWGLTDTYRLLNPNVNDIYSWFDYRSRGFEDQPKRGLRIDHIWSSKTMLKHLTGGGIDYELRGMEKPSDHCPIWADFSVNLNE